MAGERISGLGYDGRLWRCEAENCHLIEWLYLLRSAKLCALWTAQAFICANKTVRIETYTSRFGGKVLTDEKSHDFFNVPKLHPTHRLKCLLPISVPVPS
jgi:hypothetical protein